MSRKTFLVQFEFIIDDDENYIKAHIDKFLEDKLNVLNNSIDTVNKIKIWELKE